MIKIAVFSLGRGVYTAFSINQEHPLATVIRTDPNTRKEEIERVLIVRFHSQRNEYKKQGIKIEPINQNGSRRGGWKFIWWPTSILWNQSQAKAQMREEVLVNEPGLTITKKTPLAKEMEKVLFSQDEITGKITREKMVMAECNDGKFSFTPISDDIIGISQIPDYIEKHTKVD